MRILVSGSTGLIGTALCAYLRNKGMDVVPLFRGEKPGEGFDAVVHLAGRNIARHRWTQREMERIVVSRVEVARVLAEQLAQLKMPPKVVVAASGVGYYGSRGEEALTEGAEKGSGFFADLVKDWEGALDPARAAGIRVVHARMGAVLAREGGMLKKLLGPYLWGLGGRLGDGEQLLSVVDIVDVVRAFEWMIEHEELKGAVNVVMPEAVRQGAFAAVLAKKLRRPMLGHMRAGALRLLVGKMADEVLLASCYAYPKRLEESGFVFSYPTLDSSLEHLL